jgi:hypothetical protein
VLENDEENYLDQLCGKRRSVTKSQGKMNILHTIKRKKGKWIGYIFSMNCPLKHVIKNIESTGILGKINEQLLDKVTETKYWKIKQEAKRRTLWITRF